MGEVYKCTQEGVLSRLSTQVEHLEKKVGDLDKVYDLIYGLTTSMSVQNTMMAGFSEDLTQIKQNVKEIVANDVSSSVLLLTDQMVRNTKDIASTQTDVKIIQNKDGVEYNHYKRVIIGYVVLTILGFVFAAIKLL